MKRKLKLLKCKFNQFAYGKCPETFYRDFGKGKLRKNVDVRHSGSKMIGEV